MSDLTIGSFFQHEINKSQTSSQIKEENASVWQNSKAITPEKQAKELGYKKTKYPDTFYNKKTKTYYKWNEEGFNPVKHQDLEAELNGLSKTKNPIIYFNESTKKYFKWQDSKMVPQRINKIYDSGAYTFGNDVRNLTYDTKGNCKLVEYGEITYYKAGWREKLAPQEIEEFEANIAGYIKTFQEGVYCDKSGQNFFSWNIDKKAFEPTEPPKMPTLDLELEWEESLIKPLEISHINGKIENFRQGKTGDCWLLSTLYGISNSEKGKQILSEFIIPDNKGGVTINLKGANKSYYITQDDINNAIKKNQYSTGDPDVIAVELAVEKFRMENLKAGTTSVNPYNVNHMKTISYDSPLDYGTHINAIQLLTGKASTTLTPVRIYGTTNIDENLCAFNNRVDVANYYETIEKYLKDPNTIKFVALDLEYARHGVTLVGSDDEFVYLVDPQDTVRGSLPVRKEEFYNKLLHFTVSDLSTDADSKLASQKYVHNYLSPEAKEYMKQQDEKRKQVKEE